MQNASISHAPNKSELFRQNALVLTMNAMKRHIGDKDVARQALALLYSLIAPDDKVKYSLAQARQSLLANGIVDLLEDGKVAFGGERDIVATSKAILNTIATTFS